MKRTRRHLRHRGVVSVLAMMFIVIFASLAAAMAIVSQGNLRTADTYQSVNRSLAAAETGLKYADYRTQEIANSIQTSAGLIDVAMADVIWPILRNKIADQMGDDLHSTESITVTESKIVMASVPVGTEAGAPTFQVTLERHPIVGENYNAARYQREPYSVGGGENEFTINGLAVSETNPIDGRWVRIRSTGRDGAYERSVQIDSRIDKKVRFAILSRNRVMIGRNVMIRGSIGSRFTLVDYAHGHPVQMRNNFGGLDPQLDAWLLALQNYLADYDGDGDNRVNLQDEAEAAALADAASYDRNGDGYVDTYDFFLLKYDADANGALTAAEFTSTGGTMYDAQLWQLINEVKYPAGTKFDWVQMKYQIEGSSEWIDGSADMGVINNDDDYAKIAGEIIIEATAAAWEAGAAAGPYQKHLQGPIHPDPTENPLTFGANGSEMASFIPDSFDVSGYKADATGAFASQVSGAEAFGAGFTPEYTAPSASTIEATPFGSAYPYDYYMRPVYKNFTFRDVKIPKGTNALFVNCRFIGVTFIETETDTSDGNYNYAGMLNADGTAKYADVSANVNGVPVTDTKDVANNIRFHDCVFEGMIASDSPTEYAHVRNKAQFTGTATFKITDSTNLTAEQKQKFKRSTLLMPQMSVDMGTFNSPNSDGEWVQLDGTIVAGVFDIRGTATIDGSIISTYEPTPGEGPLTKGGNPASFNTTIGYFESAAGDSEAELPDGGYGKIIVRYDPYRALPDGINGPIDMRPEADTYYEGK